jgi:hypothetical protein
MVWEFPAVSQSRKEFWGKPQYTKSGMWWFTLVFGIFGLHHFLLRSPQTGLIFLIANIISLGYLWFYDLIQLSGEERGGVSEESLDKHGLSWGFGALGLAKGMWVSGEAGAEAVIPLSKGMGGINVVVNVQGSVVQEQDLAISVRDQIAILMRRRGLNPSILGV